MERTIAGVEAGAYTNMATRMGTVSPSGDHARKYRYPRAGEEGEIFDSMHRRNKKESQESGQVVNERFSEEKKARIFT